MTNTLFIRLLNQNDKGAALTGRIAALRESRSDDDVYAVDPESFRQVPNTPFCYWVSERIRRLFKELPPFESDGRTVKQGLATADDFRFVRAWWEVPAERILDSGQWAVGSEQESQGEKWTEGRIRELQAWCRKSTYEGKRWAPFAKGGEYSPYYADIHLVVNWEKDGAEIRNFVDPKTGKTNSRPQNTDYYFRPGLTYTSYTNLGFAPRILLAGSVFSIAGMGIQGVKKCLLVFLNSTVVQRFLYLIADRRKWEAGVIQRLPVPNLSDYIPELNLLSDQAWSLKRSLDLIDDTSHAFTLPTLLQCQGATLAERAAACGKHFAEAEAELLKIQSVADELAYDLYGFTAEERKAAGVAQVSAESDLESDVFEGGNAEVAALEADLVQTELAPSASTAYCLLHTANLLSWCVGVAFGRWDVRLALPTAHCLLPTDPPDPFDPLPVCPPGMLQGPGGLPAKPEDVPSDYPIRIDWDGILVDDPGHKDDIVRRIRDVLEVIWPGNSRQGAVSSGQKDGSGKGTADCLLPTADSIEREACEILGVRELRDYFRKPGNGGFWMDHVKRYSKSRRKAPIYWYLRSAKGSYGLWLYYHRLDKDILFKALLNYVEPKIRLEEDRLKSLRGRKEAAGSSGREAKQIEKDIDRQEQLVSELLDFADRLRRTANLHLEPDLNDGVVLNIAPLWELVPWKAVKENWEDLVEGKYEWSSIGKQMREKGLVKK